MTAKTNCIVYYNGWYRKVKKGELIEKNERIINSVPENVIFNESNLGIEID